MTSNEFRATFYGPANKLNRERLCVRLGIKGFAGLPLKRIGWAGFVNALGESLRVGRSQLYLRSGIY